MNLSNTQQDYIKVLWRMENDLQPARMKTVAESIGVKPPTVSFMFRQLENMDLISYNRKTGAHLTRSGHREARKIVRNHRLIETFLQKVLKLEESFLHVEAEKLEHVVSDQLIRKIDKFLGFPKTDPHGSEIPQSISENYVVAMHQIDPDVLFEIKEIPKNNPDKNFCIGNRFIPGSHWIVRQVAPRGESFLVQNGEKFLAISDHLAQQIKVIPMPEN